MSTSNPAFQWPLLKSYTQLVQANLLLLSPGSLPGGAQAGSVDAGTALAWPLHFLQGLAKNQAQFIAEVNAEALAAFAGSRGMLVAIARDE